MILKEWLKLNKGIFSDCDMRFLLKSFFFRDFYGINQAEFLDKDELACLEKAKECYRKKIPLAYIVGKEEFFGYEFKVNPKVLIPRKETELITEAAIKLIRENSLAYLLDLGCGCGNIALSIKMAVGKEINVFCSDVSFAALAVARDNARKHHLEVKFINADLLKGFRKDSFDLIVSNPPYVAPGLIEGPLRYEPREALAAAGDGIYFIEKILRNAAKYLKRNGYLIVEIGYDQRERVKNFIRPSDFELLEWIKDYSGNWRGVVLKKTEGRR